MPKSKHTNKESRRKRIVFPRQISLILPDDVLAMLNASTEQVQWESQKQAIVAGLRRSFLKFAPANIPVEVTPFEQLAFTPAIRAVQP